MYTYLSSGSSNIISKLLLDKSLFIIPFIFINPLFTIIINVYLS